MAGGFYTLSSWYVREGQISEFLRIWHDEFVPAYLQYSASTQATLIQSTEDQHRFYSFGPWESEADMQAARRDPKSREALRKLTALCEEAKAGPFRVVLTVP